MVYLWILVFIEIFLFQLSFAGNRKDIMAPSTMMIAVFIFSTLLAMLNVEKWNINFKSKTCFLITFGLVMFVLGDLCIARLYRKKQTIFVNCVGTISIKKWKMTFIILIDILILLLVYKEVIRIANTGTSFSNLYYAYRQISHLTKKDPEQYMNGIVIQMTKIVISSAFICGFVFVYNLVLCKQKIVSNFKYIFPGIIMSVMTLATGNRTNILRLFICLLLCSYILLQYRANWSMKVSRKFVKILAVSLFILFALFSMSQVLLGRSGSAQMKEIIFNYAGAPIQLLNLYVDNPPEANILWGQETFQAIWALFDRYGIINSNVSAFQEFRSLEAGNIGNVYTFFRVYYQDFGIIGMGFASFLTAIIFSWIYNYNLKSAYLNYKVVMQMIVYGYLYYLIAISSVSNCIGNYLSIGTVMLFFVFVGMFYFFFGLELLRDKYGKKIIFKIVKE